MGLGGFYKKIEREREREIGDGGGGNRVKM